jgi:oligopeptide transport system substrate-binding protein
MRLGIRKISLSGMMAVVGLIGLVAAGCGTSGGSTTAQVLHITWASGGGAPDITTLDSTEGSDTSSIPIINEIYDGLVVLDKNLQVVNWGADSVTPSADGLTYVFHIRPGQKFSDGTAVHASDYAYAMNRSENPCVASPVNYYLWTIVDASTFSNESCDLASGTITAAKGQTTPVITTLIGDSIIPDDAAGTLTVKLAAPAGYFLDAMTYSTSYALEASTVTGTNLGADEKWLDNLAKGATGQGGSGMFYVSKWDHKGNLVLKANPNWWGVAAGKKPQLSEIDYKIFVSVDTEYASYNSTKTYDVGSDIPAPQLASAKTQPDFVHALYLGYEGVAMNFNIAPFNNLDARSAFCLAINRDQMNTSIEKGAYTPSWHIVPQGMPGYYAGLQPLDNAPTTGNQTLAVQEWQKYLATLHGASVPTIQYSYNTASQTSTDFANALINTWKQVLGVNVQVNAKPWKQTLKDEAAKQVQMYRWAWIADYPDPEDFTTLLYSTTSSYNENNSGSPAIDALMTKADGLLDQSARIPLYNQAEQLLINNVSSCTIFQLANNYRVRSYVHGYVLDPQGNVPTTDWPSVSIGSH